MKTLLTHDEVLVRHAQRDPEHVLNETANQGGHEDVKADDEEAADDLEPDLAPL